MDKNKIISTSSGLSDNSVLDEPAITQLKTAFSALPFPAEYDIEYVTVKTIRPGELDIIIALDKDGGVNIDDLAQVHSSLVHQFDPIVESIVGPDYFYHVQVTSRGVSTPLELPRHWRRSQGRKVKITLQDYTKITGRIGALSSDETHIALVINELGKLSVVNYPLSSIVKAVLEIDFKNPSEQELELCAQEVVIPNG